MPSFVLKIETPVLRSPRVMQIEGMFDMPETKDRSEEWSVGLPIEDKEWSIGVIFGPSGSGKSSVLKKAFGEPDSFVWPEREAIISIVGASRPVQEVVEVLSNVGFSSPPAWLQPYSTLSTGQKFRVDMAKRILSDDPHIVVDEFTSVVDRTVAKVSSAAIAKAIRRSKKRLVVASCHYDILEWLDPDWTLEMPNADFHWRLLQGRPKIELVVAPCKRSVWGLFRRHHYLNTEIANNAKCYLATLEGQPVAFGAVMRFPHPDTPGWRGHRTVVAPDMQGVGIGNMLSELLASAYVATGDPYYSLTSHPSMIKHRAKSSVWDMTRSASFRSGGLGKSTLSVGFGASRFRHTASFRYTGVANPELAKRFGIIK